METLQEFSFLSGYFGKGFELFDGCSAVLGFEAPLFVPIRDKALELTNARKGEGSRSWSASAGATVLTVALPVVTYTLSKLRTRIEGYLGDVPTPLKKSMPVYRKKEAEFDVGYS